MNKQTENIMNTNRLSIKTALIAIMIFVSSCGIFSLHPLYEEDDLIIKNEIEGTWKNSSDEDISVTIEGIEDKKYKFQLVDDEDTIVFEMGLLKLKNQYYIDLYPPEDNDFFPGGETTFINNLLQNYIPAHTFMKFDYINDELYLTEFDNERLLELFKEEKIRLSHEIIGEDEDFVVMTASTKNLQKFVIKYSEDKKAFNETEQYTRI